MVYAGTHLAGDRRQVDIDMDKYTFTVDPAYGYVLLVVFFTYILSFWQGIMVGRMRTKLKVDYPAMYSDTEPLFNCYQV